MNKDQPRTMSLESQRDSSEHHKSQLSQMSRLLPSSPSPKSNNSRQRLLVWLLAVTFILAVSVSIFKTLLLVNQLSDTINQDQRHFESANFEPYRRVYLNLSRDTIVSHKVDLKMDSNIEKEPEIMSEEELIPESVGLGSSNEMVSDLADTTIQPPQRPRLNNHIPPATEDNQMLIIKNEIRECIHLERIINVGRPQDPLNHQQTESRCTDLVNGEHDAPSPVIIPVVPKKSNEEFRELLLNEASMNSLLEIRQVETYIDEPPQMWDALTITVAEKQKEAAKFLKSNKLVFGIPTVYRTQNYIHRTVAGLLNGLAEGQSQSVVIALLNGQIPAADHKLIPILQEKYKDQTANGQLLFLQVPTKHPQMRRPMRQNYDDELQRVYWRTKQVLDFAYLMETASKLGTFYIQLEDDLDVADNYVTEIAWWLATYYAEKSDWFMLSFYSAGMYDDRRSYNPGDFFGFIGQLYRSQTIPELVKYFRDNCDKSPVDWLMRDYMLEKVSNAKIIAHTPSVFNHIGKTSSLAGKVQPLSAHSFYQLQDLLDKPPKMRWPQPGHLQSLQDTFWRNGGMGIVVVVSSSDGRLYLQECLTLLLQYACSDDKCPPKLTIAVVDQEMTLASQDWLKLVTSVRQNVSSHWTNATSPLHLVRPSAEKIKAMRSRMWTHTSKLMDAHPYTMLLNATGVVRKGYLTVLAPWMQMYYATRKDWDIVNTQKSETKERHILQKPEVVGVSGLVLRTEKIKDLDSADIAHLSLHDRLLVRDNLRIFQHSPHIILTPEGYHS